MKIIFWGTPQYAAENLVKIVNAGHEVIAVVTQPDRKRNRGKVLTPSPVKQTALNYGIAVYTTPSISKDENTKNLLLNLNADVYIVVAFGQILPKEILSQPKLGCWNSHASLLPVWRGAAPIQWSIINDDKKTGISIMAMNEGLDTGPVIEKEETDITETDNLKILTDRLSNLSSKLLLKALERIKNTKGLNEHQRLIHLKAIDQSKLNGKPSYARQINKEDYLVQWNQNAIKISKRINGLYPNAYTLSNGKRIKIFDVSILVDDNQLFLNNIIDIKSINDRNPGEVILVNKKLGIIVMTNDKPIVIINGQLEGKSKTDGYTLAIQSNIKTDDIIGT